MPRRYPDNAIGNPGDWGVQKWGPRTRRKAWFPASTSPKIVMIIPLTEMVKPPLTEFQWWTCFLFYSLLVFWSCGMAHGTPITLYNCQSLAISDISIMSTALWVNIQKIWTKKNIEKRPPPGRIVSVTHGLHWPPMKSSRGGSKRSWLKLAQSDATLLGDLRAFSENPEAAGYRGITIVRSPWGGESWWCWRGYMMIHGVVANNIQYCKSMFILPFKVIGQLL